jgi:hypothetical protein
MLRRALVLGASVAAALVVLAAPQAASAHAPCGNNGIIEVPPPSLEIGRAASFASPLIALAGACKTPVDTVDGIFLCYSKFQVVPGWWWPDQAAELLAAGYWYPDAVPGNVDGSTDVGDYHLVCNATGTPTGQFLNRNGEVVSKDYADDNLGYYPIVKSA